MLRTLTCVLLGATLLTASTASALIPESTASAPAAPEPRPADALGSATARAAWLEGLVHGQLDAFDIPGGAVAIVDTQGPALVEGFGYANVAERRPVDPDRSRFRIASITKTFTWAAVMRLVLDGTCLQPSAQPRPDGSGLLVHDSPRFNKETAGKGMEHLAHVIFGAQEPEGAAPVQVPADAGCAAPVDAYGPPPAQRRAAGTVHPVSWPGKSQVTFEQGDKLRAPS